MHTNDSSQGYFDAIMHYHLALIATLYNDNSSDIIIFLIALGFMI